MDIRRIECGLELVQERRDINTSSFSGEDSLLHAIEGRCKCLDIEAFQLTTGLEALPRTGNLDNKSR